MSRIDRAIDITSRATASQNPWLSTLADRNLQELVGQRVTLLREGREQSARPKPPVSERPIETLNKRMDVIAVAVLVIVVVSLATLFPDREQSFQSYPESYVGGAR